MDESSLFNIINFIKNNGGLIQYTFSPNVIIGKLTPNLQTNLETKPEISKVDCTIPTEIPDENIYGTMAVLGAESFNSEKIDAEKITWEEPLEIKDDITPGISKEELYTQYVKSKYGISSGEAVARSIELPENFYETSDYLIGDVTVATIFVSSPEQVWGLKRMNYVRDNITTGLEWLKSQAPTQDISWNYWFHGVSIPIEPTDYSKSDCEKWIAWVLYKSGYDPSWVGLYEYLNDLRDEYGTDWVYVIFMVLGEQFTDGKYAFAIPRGPFVVMTYQLNGAGPERLYTVTAHETCHIFGASDEYCQPGYACGDCNDIYSYLGVPNLNSEAGCFSGYEDNCTSCVWGGNCASDFDCEYDEYCDIIWLDMCTWMDPPCPSGQYCDESIGWPPRCRYIGAEYTCKHKCLMNHVHPNICPVIKAQIGWRDSDWDGILDPIDTNGICGDPVDSDNINYEVTGTCSGGSHFNDMYDVWMCGGSKSDYCINDIMLAEYYVDPKSDSCLQIRKNCRDFGSNYYCIGGSCIQKPEPRSGGGCGGGRDIRCVKLGEYEFPLYILIIPIIILVAVSGLIKLFVKRMRTFNSE